MSNFIIVPKGKIHSIGFNGEKIMSVDVDASYVIERLLESGMLAKVTDSKDAEIASLKAKLKSYEFCHCIDPVKFPYDTICDDCGRNTAPKAFASMKAKLAKVAKFLIEEGSVVHNTRMMLRFREKCRELASELNDNKK